LAKLGITGPANFIAGTYGFLHLYGKGLIDVEDIIGGLGEEDRLTEMVFKKYPSCGATQGLTDILIRIMKDKMLQAHDIASVRVSLAPYSYKLVGHEFSIGKNPTVDGQFSAQYCIANILLRGRSTISHFLEENVRDPDIEPYLSKVVVSADAALDARGHTALDMEVQTIRGDVIRTGLDIAPGFSGNPLSPSDHVQRFHDCLDFANNWFPAERADVILPAIESIETMKDVRSLIGLLRPS
jgi:2-methylcitrate dehydratase PrpD